MDGARRVDPNLRDPKAVRSIAAPEIPGSTLGFPDSIGVSHALAKQPAALHATVDQWETQSVSSMRQQGTRPDATEGDIRDFGGDTGRRTGGNVRGAPDKTLRRRG